MNVINHNTTIRKKFVVEHISTQRINEQALNNITNTTATIMCVSEYRSAQ